MAGNIITDLVSENTAGAGVTLDGVLLKDGASNAMSPVVAATANGALAVAQSVVVVTKAGVCAMTLAAPTEAQAGTSITVVSRTAYAHTITATSLIDDGVTGGSKTTATFAAFAGASITLIAYGLKWNVLALNAVTIS